MRFVLHTSLFHQLAATRHACIPRTFSLRPRHCRSRQSARSSASFTAAGIPLRSVIHSCRSATRQTRPHRKSTPTGSLSAGNDEASGFWRATGFAQRSTCSDERKGLVFVAFTCWLTDKVFRLGPITVSSALFALSISQLRALKPCTFSKQSVVGFLY